MAKSFYDNPGQSAAHYPSQTT